ncbi:MAG: ATP-binding protein [Chitinophagaceae bacterium]
MFNFLQTIMQNLTNNAIKARDVNKQSTITWVASSTSANGKIQLAITDNGKGLSKQQIATLLSNENVNSQKNGLGFFIVKDLAKAIDLSINISSIKGEKPPLH